MQNEPQVLRFTCLRLTHDGLMAILEASPLLSESGLVSTDVVGTRTRSFTHANVKRLTVNLDSLFPVCSVGPSLLSYFPKLTTLSTWSSTSSFVFPVIKVKEDIARFCPRLTEPILSDHFGTLVPNFCSHVSIKLSMITFLFDRLSTQGIMALLLHQATLKRIYAFQESGFDFEQHTFPPLSTHLHESSRFPAAHPEMLSAIGGIKPISP